MSSPVPGDPGPPTLPLERAAPSGLGYFFPTKYEITRNARDEKRPVQYNVMLEFLPGGHSHRGQWDEVQNCTNQEDQDDHDTKRIPDLHSTEEIGVFKGPEYLIQNEQKHKCGDQAGYPLTGESIRKREDDEHKKAEPQVFFDAFDPGGAGNQDKQCEEKKEPPECTRNLPRQGRLLRPLSTRPVA